MLLSEFSKPKLGGKGGMPWDVRPRAASELAVETCGGLCWCWAETMGLFWERRPAPVILGLLWPPMVGGVMATLGGGEQETLLLRSLVVDADESIVDSIIMVGDRAHSYSTAKHC